MGGGARRLEKKAKVSCIGRDWGAGRRYFGVKGKNFKG